MVTCKIFNIFGDGSCVQYIHGAQIPPCLAGRELGSGSGKRAGTAVALYTSILSNKSRTTFGCCSETSFLSSGSSVTLKRKTLFGPWQPVEDWVGLFISAAGTQSPIPGQPISNFQSPLLSAAWRQWHPCGPPKVESWQSMLCGHSSSVIHFNPF